MSSLEQLYQQVILDHARERHGARGNAAALTAGAEPAPSGRSRQFNALCGDEVDLRVVLDPGADGGGPVVREVAWVGDGCSISQAAVSVLHDLVAGATVPQAQARVDAYREMLRSRGAAAPNEEDLGDAVAFAGVSRHVNRVKCAMLGWTAFEDALAQASADLLDRTDPPAPATNPRRTS